MSEQQKRGFACGDNAVVYGRKAHELGVAHQFSAREAGYWGRKNSREQGRDERGRLLPKRGEHGTQRT